MNPDCVSTREVAPELALGILDGAARAEALLHVASCGDCQRFLNELAGVADGLARLAPEVEPPLGFSRRVDAAIRGSRRRVVRRWVGSVAAVAAAAAIVSITLVRVVDAGSTHSVAAPVVHSVDMVGASGARVGHVVVSATSPAAVAVNVDYSVPDGTYGLEVRQPGSPPRHFGWITVAGGHGQWTGSTTMPKSPDATVVLVAPGGDVVCRAAVNAPVAT